MKGHTGSIFSLGHRRIDTGSTEQKINSRSSTEAELVGADDKISKIAWTKKFPEV